MGINTANRQQKPEGKIELSDRLMAVADMVTKGNTVCDVGCDHGFVPIYLVKTGISPAVIAMDIGEGPLNAAREHIRAYGLTDYIETRRSDGVRALQEGEAGTLICAGMGGRLMRRILEEGREKLAGMEELILQPQSDIRGLREYLRGEGYLTVEENMILEEGKYYPVMKLCPRQHIPSESREEEGLQGIFDQYGPLLIKEKNPVLGSFLKREYRICGQILDNLRKNGSRQADREQEVLDKRRDIETALALLEEPDKGKEAFL